MSSEPIPLDPRSWTANSNSASSTSGSPWSALAVTALIQRAHRRLVMPAEALPAQHAEASDHPDRLRSGAVARSWRRARRPARRGRARSRPGGRTPSTRCRRRCDGSPSSKAHRRSAERPRAADDPAAPGEVELRPGAPTWSGSDIGSRMVPPLATRRSCTAGRSAWSISCHQHLTERIGPIEASARSPRAPRRVVAIARPAPQTSGIPPGALATTPADPRGAPRRSDGRWPRGRPCRTRD